MDVISTLKELSLNDNEAHIYLACLTLGSSKVHEIAKHSRIIRTTTYSILKSLSEKGLVSTVLKDNVNYYQAADPQQLIDILEEKKKHISTILPQLKKLQEYTPNKQHVSYFEGREGFKTLVNDLLTKPDQTILMIAYYSKWLNFSDSFTDIFYRKKKELNIHARVIMDSSERIHAKHEKIVNSQTKYVDNLETHAEIFIYHDKVAYATIEENNVKGIIIQDKNICELQKKVFEQLWEVAKE